MRSTLLILMAILSVGLALWTIHKYRSETKTVSEEAAKTRIFHPSEVSLDPNFARLADYV